MSIPIGICVWVIFFRCVSVRGCVYRWFRVFMLYKKQHTSISVFYAFHPTTLIRLCVGLKIESYGLVVVVVAIHP